MPRLKQFLRRPGVRAVLCAVLAAYIRFVHATSRWQVEGGEIPARFWDEGKPFILAFWHGRLLLMPYCWRKGTPIQLLISQHSDGLFISETIRRFGLGTVAGSSSRGGAAALRTMLKTLQANHCVGLTPDGPRGPRMRASNGVIQAARLAEVPILPCTLATRRRRALGSWDRFLLVLPFTRGLYIWDRPITVPRGASDEEIEAARRYLEERLNTITAEADRRMGVEPIEPAPLADVAAGANDAEAARIAGAGR